jgi:hypothetical protein
MAVINYTDIFYIGTTDIISYIFNASSLTTYDVYTKSEVSTEVKIYFVDF